MCVIAQKNALIKESLRNKTSVQSCDLLIAILI